MCDKTIISHSVVLAQGVHEAEGRLESLLQNYSVRYCGFIPWPCVLAIEPHDYDMD